IFRGDYRATDTLTVISNNPSHCVISKSVSVQPPIAVVPRKERSRFLLLGAPKTHITIQIFATRVMPAPGNPAPYLYDFRYSFSLPAVFPLAAPRNPA
ncbi:hypothetical protein, partial [Phaeobacter sp. B1627]|uniref:hypothetical protein n=1 Tax=Phaeobacter sp. B1627 TaxID=2583809 RepID=UPI001C4008FC